MLRLSGANTDHGSNLKRNDPDPNAELLAF